MAVNGSRRRGDRLLGRSPPSYRLSSFVVQLFVVTAAVRSSLTLTRRPKKNKKMESPLTWPLPPLSVGPSVGGWVGGLGGDVSACRCAQAEVC